MLDDRAFNHIELLHITYAIDGTKTKIKQNSREIFNL